MFICFYGNESIKTIIMNNPFEHFAKDLTEIKSLLLKVQDSIPKPNPIKRYSIKDIADNTPIGIQTIRAAIKDGRIKAERFGNRFLITQEEFNRVCREVKNIKYKRN